MSGSRSSRGGWPAVALLAMLCCSRCCCGRPPDGAAATTEHRLPDDTRPVSYELTVRPNYGRVRDRVEFEGEVKITVSVRSATRAVTVHCRGLDVKAVYVYERRTERGVDVRRYAYDDARERLTVELTSRLDAGAEYVLDVEFYGRVDNGSDGFYKSSYGRGE